MPLQGNLYALDGLDAFPQEVLPPLALMQFLAQTNPRSQNILLRAGPGRARGPQCSLQRRINLRVSPAAVMRGSVGTRALTDILLHVCQPACVCCCPNEPHRLNAGMVFIRMQGRRTVVASASAAVAQPTLAGKDAVRSRLEVRQPGSS